tara:strand:+ start:17103 stop:17972 length:870 start_codon:yes stop_codon:yes gene_type:complete
VKVLVTGAGGQLAHAVAARMKVKHQVISLTRKELDLTRYLDVMDVVREEQPDAIINGAAYNDVDGAEDDPVAAMAVNAFGVRALAQAAVATRAVLVHFSTDFVFDGNADQPYTEQSIPNPQSAYAISKLIGEWFATEAQHYILRVESLFGGGLLPFREGRKRGSSLDRIADAILAGEEVRAFTDRTVTPSYVDDVAEATAVLLASKPPEGIYHCVGSDMGTWMDLAAHLAAELKRPSRIIPVQMASMKLKAKRPQFCALSNVKLRSLGIVMPTWQDAVSRYAKARLNVV